VAGAGEQADARLLMAHHQPIAVVLDCVNPAGAGRRTLGGGLASSWSSALKARPASSPRDSYRTVAETS